jgi:hypothetical protein
MTIWLSAGSHFPGFVFSLASNNHLPIKRVSLTTAMNQHRKRWMQVAARRDLRMIDTAIMAGLQNGTAFFASTTIFAIGGCFALAWRDRSGDGGGRRSADSGWLRIRWRSNSRSSA